MSPEVYRLFGVHLSVKCAAEGCLAEQSFCAKTRALCMKAARDAGWSFPRRLYAFCDEHKGAPPSYR